MIALYAYCSLNAQLFVLDVPNDRMKHAWKFVCAFRLLQRPLGHSFVETQKSWRLGKLLLVSLGEGRANGEIE
jgi:CRISPR/Cas system-associated exonuclease Cas4 (RecB family)